MTVLLKGRRSYNIATLLALLLHIALGYGVWLLQDELVESAKAPPPSLFTSLVTPDLTPLGPLQTSLIIEQPPPPPPPKPEVEEKPKAPKPERVAPVKKAAKPSPTKPKKQAQPEKKPVAEQRPTGDLDALVQALNKPAPTTTPSTQGQQQPMTPEMRVASRYVERIQRQIESAWIQPPNIQYREMAGLRVLIRLTLETSGRLVNARILSSSGNAQFDRSALNAVYKVGRFEVPADAEIFDRFFRQVNINYSL